MEDGDRPGFRTDNKSKAIGTRLVQQLVNMNCLKFHKKFFTSPMGNNLKQYASKIVSRIGTISTEYYNSAVNNADSNAREQICEVAAFAVKERIIQQLSNWTEERIESEQTFEIKVRYHGKAGGQKDDMAVCIISAPLFIRKHQNTSNIIHEIKQQAVQSMMPEEERLNNQKDVYNIPYKSYNHHIENNPLLQGYLSSSSQSSGVSNARQFHHLFTNSSGAIMNNNASNSLYGTYLRKQT